MTSETDLTGNQPPPPTGNDEPSATDQVQTSQDQRPQQSRFNASKFPEYTSVYVTPPRWVNIETFISAQRLVTPHHFLNGYWLFASHGRNCDDERAFMLGGYTSPEQILKHALFEPMRVPTDVKLRWIPSCLEDYQKAWVANARDHVGMIRLQRQRLGLFPLKIGETPVYGVDMRKKLQEVSRREPKVETDWQYLADRAASLSTGPNGEGASTIGIQDHDHAGEVFHASERQSESLKPSEASLTSRPKGPSPLTKSSNTISDNGRNAPRKVVGQRPPRTIPYNASPVSRAEDFGISIPQRRIPRTDGDNLPGKVHQQPHSATVPDDSGRIDPANSQISHYPQEPATFVKTIRAIRHIAGGHAAHISDTPIESIESVEIAEDLSNSNDLTLHDVPPSVRLPREPSEHSKSISDKTDSFSKARRDLSNRQYLHGRTMETIKALTVNSPKLSSSSVHGKPEPEPEPERHRTTEHLVNKHLPTDIARCRITQSNDDPTAPVLLNKTHEKTKNIHYFNKTHDVAPPIDDWPGLIDLWEEKIPCMDCGSEGNCRSDCAFYNFLDKPMQRLTKADREELLKTADSIESASKLCLNRAPSVWKDDLAEQDLPESGETQLDGMLRIVEEHIGIPQELQWTSKEAKVLYGALVSSDIDFEIIDREGIEIMEWQLAQSGF